MSAPKLRLVPRHPHSSIHSKSIYQDKDKSLTMADLYAGIGGFHLAFHQIGIDCSFAVEKDKYARQTYEHNFSSISPQLFDGKRFFHDVDGIANNPDQMPEMDILSAGFPCVSFSVAGKRMGIHDPKNGRHIFSLLKILKAKQPKAFFFENVKGLLSANDGKAFRLIERSIKNLGYSFHWQVMKACEFGNVPQLRPRVHMVGFRDPSTQFTFPKPIPLTITMSDVFGAPCHREIGKTILSSGRNRRVGQSRNWDCYLVNGKERWLSIREVKQMQGFPDWFEFPVSDPQAFKQLGNAVALPVVKAIARELVASLQSHAQQKRSKAAA